MKILFFFFLTVPLLPCEIQEMCFTCCKNLGNAAGFVHGLLEEGRCSCASVTPNPCWGVQMSLQGVGAGTHVGCGGSF